MMKPFVACTTNIGKLTTWGTENMNYIINKYYEKKLHETDNP